MEKSWLGVKVFFGGAEKGSYRSLLVANNVKRFGINLTHFAIPKKKELIIPEMFNNGEVLVYTSENDEDLTKFDSFIRTYGEQLDTIIGRPDYDGSWINQSLGNTNKYVPLWNDENDLERLSWLCQKYGRVAISDKAINSKNISRIRQLAARWGVELIGITSKPDIIEALPWSSVVVNSWTSVIRYGETQVWDGHGLRRYPAQQKESSRKKHRADITRLGVDIDSVMSDEVSAVGTLAIRSWQQWETHNYGAYDPSKTSDEHEMKTVK